MYRHVRGLYCPDSGTGQACVPSMGSGTSWCRVTIAAIKGNPFLASWKLSTLESQTGKRHSLGRGGGYVWLYPKAD